MDIFCDPLHCKTYFSVWQIISFHHTRLYISPALPLFLYAWQNRQSHTGIHYRWNKIDQLESFYFKVKDLFPRQFWHLLGQDLLKLLDTKKQPLLLKLAKSSTTEHPTTQEDYVRLQLYSTKERKALAAFKFCLHLACIGRPRSLELQVAGLEITTCC